MACSCTQLPPLNGMFWRSPAHLGDVGATLVFCLPDPSLPSAPGFSLFWNWGVWGPGWGGPQRRPRSPTVPGSSRGGGKGGARPQRPRPLLSVAPFTRGIFTFPLFPVHDQRSRREAGRGGLRLALCRSWGQTARAGRGWRGPSGLLALIPLCFRLWSGLRQKPVWSLPNPLP